MANSKDITPNLHLPYLIAAQAQKHVTHNEAIRSLDAVVQLSVVDRAHTAPPATPAEGERYIVAGGATGVFADHVGQIAAWQDGGWLFRAATTGWIAYVAAENIAVVWTGSAWIGLPLSAGSIDNADHIGVNAVADATNRLSVSAAATLLNHAGAGHQLKINKAASEQTASLLFQDAFSGRAEVGLAGDDNLHVKVSADGATWREAIVVDRTSGVVSFPSGATGLATGDPT